MALVYFAIMRSLLQFVSGLLLLISGDNWTGFSLVCSPRSSYHRRSTVMNPIQTETELFVYIMLEFNKN